ncbi:hypothetical protein NX059_005760 [Plenodomus lindquistii]|nr:hypothetical protein NX059_005760 [Plenodomus lindquistii]
MSRKIHIDKKEDAEKRLQILSNATRYFSMVLPSCLKYNNQYLNFDTGPSTGGSAGIATNRIHHSSIYSIHLMIQLSKMMIYKSQTFKSGVQWGLNQRDRSHHYSASQDDVVPYFEAADAILNITHKCHESHYRYVNPLLANTVWLAAAVQLLRKELAYSNDTENELVSSNFAVLSMTYDQFEAFWRPSHTPKQNLATLERSLASLRDRMPDTFAERTSRCPAQEQQPIPRQHSSSTNETPQTICDHSTRLPTPARSTSMENRPSVEVQQGSRDLLSPWSSSHTIPNTGRDQHNAPHQRSQSGGRCQSQSRQPDSQCLPNLNSNGTGMLSTPDYSFVAGVDDSEEHHSLPERESGISNTLNSRNLPMFDASFLDAFHFEGYTGLDADAGGLSDYLGNLLYGDPLASQ